MAESPFDQIANITITGAEAGASAGTTDAGASTTANETDHAHASTGDEEGQTTAATDDKAKADEADDAKPVEDKPKAAAADKAKADTEKPEDKAAAEQDKPADDAKPEDQPEEKQKPGPDANTAQVRAWGEGLEQQLKAQAPIVEQVNLLGGEKYLQRIVPVAQALQDAHATGDSVLDAIAKVAPYHVQEIAWAAVAHPRSQELILKETFGADATLDELKAAWAERTGKKVPAEANATGAETDADTADDESLDWLPESIATEVKEGRRLKAEQAKREQETKNAQQTEAQKTQQAEIARAATAFDDECAAVIDAVIAEYKLDVGDGDPTEEKELREFAGMLTRLASASLYFSDEVGSKPYKNAKGMILKGEAAGAEDLKLGIHAGLQGKAQRIARYLNRLITDARDARKLRAQKIKDLPADTTTGGAARTTDTKQTETKKSKANLGTAEGDQELVNDIAGWLREHSTGK
jgi:hypothetical protein